VPFGIGRAYLPNHLVEMVNGRFITAKFVSFFFLAVAFSWIMVVTRILVIERGIEASQYRAHGMSNIFATAQH
jgi:hypothetical protein